MLLSSLATSIYARITFVLGLCAWGIPTAVGFSQMTSCRLQSNYSSMIATLWKNVSRSDAQECNVWLWQTSRDRVSTDQRSSS